MTWTCSEAEGSSAYNQTEIRLLYLHFGKTQKKIEHNVDYLISGSNVGKKNDQPYF